MPTEDLLAKTLHENFITARSRNPAFSQRAFARRLGISPGALSEIFRGRRNVSLKLAEQLFDKLLLDPQTRSEILRSVAFKRGMIADSASESYSQLSSDQFSVIAEWIHYAILSLMRTKDFRSDPNWVAGRLGVSPTEARDAVDRLLRAGLVQLKDNGDWERSHSKYKTSDNVLNIAMRRSHLEDLELIRDSLQNEAIDDRDYSSITMPINKNNLAKARERIRRFQDEIAELLEAGDTHDVYRLSVGLHPLTTKRKRL